jgi:hypothetical protein
MREFPAPRLSAQNNVVFCPSLYHSILLSLCRCHNMGVSCNIARPKPKERDKHQRKQQSTNCEEKNLAYHDAYHQYSHHHQRHHYHHQQHHRNFNYCRQHENLLDDNDIRLVERRESNYKSIEQQRTTSSSSYALLNFLSWKFNKFLDNDVVRRRTSSSFLHSSFISYLITSSHNIVRQSLCSYATTSILLILLCYLTTSTVATVASSSIADTIHPM